MSMKEKKEGILVKWHFNLEPALSAKWYFNLKQAFIEKWNFIQKKNPRAERAKVGIYETATGIAMVYGLAKAGSLLIKSCRYQAAKDLKERQAIVTQFVAEHQLQDAECCYVLETHDYNLNLLEAPKVPKKEINQAVRWVVKDLIHFPVEEAIIDVFDLPVARARDNMKMIYVVVSQKSVIQRIESFITSTGLILETIDIPELVLKNVIVKALANLKEGAFIYLTQNSGKVILYRENQIYITRSFEIKLSTTPGEIKSDNKTLDLLALEIQRSFDYLNSVFRHSMQNNIVLAPTLIEGNIIQEFLRNALGGEVKILKLVDCLKFEKPIKEEEEANCLLAIGAVLREETVLNDPTN